MGCVLGTEHNVVPGLHLVVGGELFHHCFSLHIGSLELKDKVLPSGTLAPYWSNFVEVYNDFENRVEVHPG